MKIGIISILLGIDQQGSCFVLHYIIIILYSSFVVVIIYSVVASMNNNITSCIYVFVYYCQLTIYYIVNVV